jgi:hypothetical protein
MPRHDRPSHARASAVTAQSNRPGHTKISRLTRKDELHARHGRPVESSQRVSLYTGGARAMQQPRLLRDKIECVHGLPAKATACPARARSGSPAARRLKPQHVSPCGSKPHCPSSTRALAPLPKMLSASLPHSAHSFPASSVCQPRPALSPQPAPRPPPAAAAPLSAPAAAPPHALRAL